MNGTPADQAKGEDLLRQLHEPNETRLGYSAGKVGGHGFGDQLADLVWQTLQTNQLARHAVISRLEDLPLYIDHVAEDLISDLTTRIVYPVLAKFTQQMVTRYPSLGVNQTTESVLHWDTTSKTWVPKNVLLPHTHGHQLLLVPKDWTYWRLVMDPDAFYNNYSTNKLQIEQTKMVNGQASVLRFPQKRRGVSYKE